LENEKIVEAFLAGNTAKVVARRLIGTPFQESNTMMSFVLEKS
jgi:hypothetical protein